MSDLQHRRPPRSSPGLAAMPSARLAALCLLLASGCRVLPPEGEDVQTSSAMAAEQSGDPSSRPAPVTVSGDAEIDRIWNDPTFKKQFTASYGVNSEIEPRVMPEEVLVLEKVRPLMATDVGAAERLLKGSIKPNSTATFDFTLAGIQFQQDRVDEALANYKKAVDKFPGFRRAWRNLGLLHVRTAAYEQAIRSFTKMIELGGGDGYAYGLLGAAYSAQQDYIPAESAYRNAMLLQPDSNDWRLGLARCLFKQEKFEDAASLLNALIARNPDKADFWLLQAHAYLGMKQPLRAAENLEAVDRLGKGTVDSLHTLGDIYVTENLPDLALAAYRRALDVDAEQPIARPLRSAETLAARGAAPQAKELAARIREKRSASLAEEDRRKLLKLEARLRMAEGPVGQETADVLEEIVKLDPLDGEALMLLGQHYSKNEQPDRALLYYERAGAIESYEVDAKVRQAQILVGLNRHTEALPLLRRAQELKPREGVARYLEQVEKVARAKR